MGRHRWAQESGEGRPGPVWSMQCCWPVLSCAAPMLDTFGFLLDSSSQTTVLSSRRHDVGQGHTSEDQSLGCGSQEGIAASVLEENKAFKPPGFPSLSHWGTWDSKARTCDLMLWVTPPF